MYVLLFFSLIISFPNIYKKHLSLFIKIYTHTLIHLFSCLVHSLNILSLIIHFIPLLSLFINPFYIILFILIKFAYAFIFNK
jgi:hypothetical protein